MAVDYKKWGMAGAAIGLVSYALAWIYSLVFQNGGAGTVTFSTLDVNVRQQITSGVDTSLGSQILNVFGGNFDAITGGMIGAILLSVIGGTALVLVGRLIYNFLPFGKTATTRLVAVLLYGSIVGGWLLSFMSGSGGIKIPALNAIIAMAIYFFIVAIVYGWLNKTQAGKYFPIPQ